MGQFPLGPQLAAGVSPDIAVTPTIEDLAAGRAAEPATVRALR